MYNAVIRSDMRTFERILARVRCEGELYYIDQFASSGETTSFVINILRVLATGINVVSDYPPSVSVTG